METTWTVLRTFGYDDDLTLREDFLYPQYSNEIAIYIRFAVPYDCSVELSSSGYQFFIDIFQAYDLVLFNS